MRTERDRIDKQLAGASSNMQLWHALREPPPRPTPAERATCSSCPPLKLARREGRRAPWIQTQP
jgi:hypothetical protein